MPDPGGAAPDRHEIVEGIFGIDHETSSPSGRYLAISAWPGGSREYGAGPVAEEDLRRNCRRGMASALPC
jgi:hypothetical protein